MGNNDDNTIIIEDLQKGCTMVVINDAVVVDDSNKKKEEDQQDFMNDFIALLSHIRWDICGFPPIIQDKHSLLMRKNSVNTGIMNVDEINDLNPLYCFEDKKNGFMALTLFTSFLNCHK